MKLCWEQMLYQEFVKRACGQAIVSSFGYTIVIHMMKRQEGQSCLSTSRTFRSAILAVEGEDNQPNLCGAFVPSKARDPWMGFSPCLSRRFLFFLISKIVLPTFLLIVKSQDCHVHTMTSAVYKEIVGDGVGPSSLPSRGSIFPLDDPTIKHGAGTSCTHISRSQAGETAVILQPRM